MGCVVGSMASCFACSAISCCASATCSMCGKTVACTKSTATRAVYVFQFIVISAIAYLFSNFASNWLSHVQVLEEGCERLIAEEGGTVACYGELAVFRICFGLTLYHAILALLLIGVKNSTDWRAAIQDGWFPVKFLVLIALIVVSYFIPNTFFKGYGWVMVIGSGLFIIVQLVLLIEFAYSWAESWLLKMEDEEADGTRQWFWILMVTTFSILGAGIALTGVMYKFFCESGCGLNTFFVTANLIAAVGYCFLCLSSRVREGRPSSGLLQSAVIFMYCTYLVWSAMSSEPSEACNPFAQAANSKSAKMVSLIVGAIFTIISVVYSTIKAGGASEELLGGGDVEKPLLTNDDTSSGDGESSTPQVNDDEQEGTVYNYSFFHLSFALGSMYVCMLLTNWMQTGSDVLAVDFGNGSVWVKMISSWVVILLYVWTLIAPVVLPDREWN